MQNLKHTHVHVKVYPLTSQNAPIIIYIHLMYAGTLEREKIYTAECTKWLIDLISLLQKIKFINTELVLISIFTNINCWLWETNNNYLTVADGGKNKLKITNNAHL